MSPHFQTAILAVLPNKDEQGIPPRQIFERLGVEHPTLSQRASLSRAISRLAAQGLVVGLRTSIEFVITTGGGDADASLRGAQFGHAQAVSCELCLFRVEIVAGCATLACGGHTMTTQSYLAATIPPTSDEWMWMADSHLRALLEHFQD